MKMTDTYEWVVLDNKELKVGITKKAQKEIGEIVHLHLPKKGEKVKKGEALLVLESTKSAIDSYAPVSGEVVEVNTDLDGNLGHVNSDPEGKGWLIRIKPDNIDEYHALEDYSLS